MASSSVWQPSRHWVWHLSFSPGRDRRQFRSAHSPCAGARHTKLFARATPANDFDFFLFVDQPTNFGAWALALAKAAAVTRLAESGQEADDQQSYHLC